MYHIHVDSRSLLHFTSKKVKVVVLEGCLNFIQIASGTILEVKNIYSAAFPAILERIVKLSGVFITHSEPLQFSICLRPVSYSTFNLL